MNYRSALPDHRHRCAWRWQFDRQSRLMLCALLLAGCSMTGSRTLPTPSYYLLESTRPSQNGAVAANAAASACRSLRIGSTSSAPGLLTAKMAYQRSAAQLEYFALHRWVEPPATMLANALARDLEASGLFSTVLSGSADVVAELRLDSQLLKLRQVFEDDSSRIEFVVRIDLVSVADRTLLLSEVLSYGEPAAPNPVAGVAAANRGLQQFLEDLRRLLSAVAAEAGDCTQPIS